MIKKLSVTDKRADLVSGELFSLFKSLSKEFAVIRNKLRQEGKEQEADQKFLKLNDLLNEMKKLLQA